MKRPFLNHWQRLGVVASVVWALAAGIWRWVEGKQAATIAATEAYDLCRRAADAHKGCFRLLDTALQSGMDRIWVEVAWSAVAPVALGWILAYAVIWTVRWVLAGRRPKPAS